MIGAKACKYLSIRDSLFSGFNIQEFTDLVLLDISYSKIQSVDLMFSSYLEKAIIDKSQEVSTNNDSHIWLRPFKEQNILINAVKLPVEAVYGIFETKEYYK